MSIMRCVTLASQLLVVSGCNGDCAVAEDTPESGRS